MKEKIILIHTKKLNKQYALYWFRYNIDPAYFGFIQASSRINSIRYGYYKIIT